MISSWWTQWHDREIDVNAFMYDHPICSCDGSPFIYQPNGHIVTGNVSIVGSNVLEDLFTYSMSQISRTTVFQLEQKF